MKRNERINKTLIKGIVASLLLITSISCSHSESTNPNATTTAATSTSPFATSAGGATATFVPDSPTALNAFVGRTVINPTNFTINLNVFNEANSGQAEQYGGSFSLSYIENGVQHNPDVFNSGTSIFDTTYNKWYNTNGVSRLVLFFQDNVGGIIVILKQVSINDIEVTLQGDVYYRNFDFSVCSNPPPYLPPMCGQQSPYAMCWGISAGPYDCRAFLSNGQIRPDVVSQPGFGDTQLGYSGPGWQHLGTFSGIDLSKALNGT